METQTHDASGCCTGQHCDSGRRNRYYPNKRITPDTYEVEQDYQLQRRRLLNRAIHGWGVVYGFRLGTGDADHCSEDGERHLAIGSGLALDPCGRELVQAKRVLLDFPDLLLFDQKGKYFERTMGNCRSRDGEVPWGDEGEKLCFELRAHYAERLISPVAQRDPCQCDRQEWDQVCETVRYSLKPLFCEECCKADKCDLCCECKRGPCCPEGDAKPTERGGCRCLCEHLMHFDPTPDCCSLTTVGKGLKVDLCHGVPLACVRLMRDDCGDWTIRDIADACGPRRLVKRNDLLFDLIRGCDLTRIEEIGWAPFHRAKDPIAWDIFVPSFDGTDDSGVRLTRDYWIRFSKPIQTETIHRDCFTFSAIFREFEGGWGEILRVPIGVRWQEDPEHKGHTSRVDLVVDSDWLHDAINDNSRFEQYISRIEITVRGDYLLDCNGQAVDANARGRSPAPTGNGVPGDTYISTFQVQQKPPRGRQSSNIG
jgi:hypothetical protein